MSDNELIKNTSEEKDIWDKYKDITSIQSKKEWVFILQDRKALSESIFKTQELWNIYLKKYHNHLRGVEISPDNLEKVVHECEQNYSLYGELRRCMSCSPVLIYWENPFDEYTDDIYLPEFLDSFIYTPDTAGSKWGVNIQSMLFHLHSNRNKGFGAHNLCISVPYIEKLEDNTFLLDTHLHRHARSGNPVILKTFNDLEKLDISKAKQYTWKNFLFSYNIYYSPEGYSIYMHTTADTSLVKSRCIKSCVAATTEEENFKSAMLWLYKSKIFPHIVWEETSECNKSIPYVADKLEESIQSFDYPEDTYRIVAIEWGYTVWRLTRQRKFVPVAGSNEENWELGEEELVGHVHMTKYCHSTPEENMKHAKQKLEPYIRNKHA